MMQVRHYEEVSSFRADVFDILAVNEIQNNLPIDLITGRKLDSTEGFLLATVCDNDSVVLTAIYVKPFHLLLYETGNRRNDAAVLLFARELSDIGVAPAGVMAESTLARRFANAYRPAGDYRRHMSVAGMKLDKPVVHSDAPGRCRALEAGDLFFAPYWERAFSEDCRTTVFTITENTERLKTRLKKGTHYIWEDGVPVSQAVHGRDTPNGALINGVYTPPFFRGRGYASSVVATLSNTLLEHGKGFCCLLADADNPASYGMYRKLGYSDVCKLEDIRFVTSHTHGLAL